MRFFSHSCIVCLITNTSGLGNWTPSSDSGEELHRLYRERGITPGNYGKGRSRAGYGAQPATLDELVSRVADLPLAYEPGTVLHYSIGFDVMALGVNSSPDSPADLKLPPGFRVADDRATSEWLKPPALLAGGAGVVSTSRDFLRYAQMLLGDGAFAGTRVMRPETARLATGDINPPGVADPSDGAGSGTRALLRTPLIPTGSVGGGGAAGTLFWIDKSRRGAVVFMTQVMYGSPARSPFQKRLFAAIEKDLSAG